MDKIYSPSQLIFTWACLILPSVFAFEFRQQSESSTRITKIFQPKIANIIQVMLHVYNLSLELAAETRRGFLRQTQDFRFQRTTSFYQADVPCQWKDSAEPLRVDDGPGESHEGVVGVLVTRLRAWRHGQGHSQHNQEVVQVPLPQHQLSGWRFQEYYRE